MLGAERCHRTTGAAEVTGEDSAFLRKIKERAEAALADGLRTQLNLGDFESRARTKAGSYAVRISVNEVLRLLKLAGAD